MKNTLLILVLLSSNLLLAQLNAEVIGDAIDQGNNCYTITQNLDFQAGGVWFDNAINFDNDFTIYYQNNFGSKDTDGADGMALVFKGNPSAVIGSPGGGIGYQGITPSLVIEFDTYQNNIPAEGLLDDPAFDHIAIMRNGDPNHNSVANNLAGPVQASGSNPNIEDGVPHEVKIEWIAASNQLNIFFDCDLRLTLNQNVKQTIFSGDDSVFFGFVGSTGGLSNIHEVCFNSISFVDNLQLQDRNVCEGETVIVDASIPSGVNYSWSPTEGISDPNSPNPFFTPSTTTTYTVTIEDICGETTTGNVTLTVLPESTPVFDSVDPICFGETLNPLPTISNNGITGVWTPALNNTVTTTYTFIPDTNQCALSSTMEIVVNPIIIPFFDPIDPVCQGEALSPLPNISTNGISGFWSPTLDTSQTTLYTFTPEPGQGCTVQATLLLEVITKEVPVFDAIAPQCEGASINPLPTVSNNGISGSWSPEVNNLVTTTYVFIPDVDECAESTSLVIEIVPIVTPLFDQVQPICRGETLTPLPVLSLNGVSGSWSPDLNNQGTTLYIFTPDFDECASTVTMEIEVVPLVIPEFDPVDPICPGDTLSDLPLISNNGIEGVWSPELNNLETTIYTFTPLSGQGCTVESTLEIVVIDPVVPVFNERDSICEGDVMMPLPVMSANGVSGSWSPDLNNQETTTYTFTPDPGQCTNVQVSLEIIVNPIFELGISVSLVSEPFAENQTVEAMVTGGSGNYEYSLDGIVWQESNVFQGLTGCDELEIKAREITTCSNIASAKFRVFDYPNFFTPNGDSNNDFWNIYCLQDQSNAIINIYDRYGKELTRIRPDGPGWDGRYNGQPSPANDYWFKVSYSDPNGELKILASHFSLKR
ncbi:lectin-like domain-containing protein [Winogradskyella aurantiaca]|uniref:lectin-like domain-containing protein n=1 Tax=Winogradskyella aurantiaca TaxID=2219558 RepID=UPI000E1DD594|nr:T9SS type B sorting domain-containing protein [Winogradskyella aurantiaca]